MSGNDIIKRAVTLNVKSIPMLCLLLLPLVASQASTGYRDNADSGVDAEHVIEQARDMITGMKVKKDIQRKLKKLIKATGVTNKMVKNFEQAPKLYMQVDRLEKQVKMLLQASNKKRVQGKKVDGKAGGNPAPAPKPAKSP